MITHPATIVWVLLMLATLLLGWLGLEDGSGPKLSSATLAITILTLAFIKVSLVIRYFMEVRDAPPWLRRITGGWVAVVGVSLVLVLGIVR